MINEKQQLEFARDLIQDLVRLAVSQHDSRGGTEAKGAKRAVHHLFSYDNRLISHFPLIAPPR